MSISREDCDPLALTDRALSFTVSRSHVHLVERTATLVRYSAVPFARTLGRSHVHLVERTATLFRKILIDIKVKVGAMSI